jgi:hypothetical protein
MTEVHVERAAEISTAAIALPSSRRTGANVFDTGSDNVFVALHCATWGHPRIVLAARGRMD